MSYEVTCVLWCVNICLPSIIDCICFCFMRDTLYGIIFCSLHRQELEEIISIFTSQSCSCANINGWDAEFRHRVFGWRNCANILCSFAQWVQTILLFDLELILWNLHRKRDIVVNFKMTRWYFAFLCQILRWYHELNHW